MIGLLINRGVTPFTGGLMGGLNNKLLLRTDSALEVEEVYCHFPFYFYVYNNVICFLSHVIYPFLIQRTVRSCLALPLLHSANHIACTSWTILLHLAFYA